VRDRPADTPLADGCDDLVDAEARAGSEGQAVEVFGLSGDHSGKVLINVWSAPPLQVSAESMAEAVCVNVSGLLVEPPLLALMEYARTGPYNGGGHNGPGTQPG
jgi:hypothetical protein